MSTIKTPTLLLDEEICRANIRCMAQKAAQNNLQFKPHMKTHQSAEIGGWLRKEGVEAITVSSVNMAQYFADHGWKNITIAFPCNLLEVDAINSLAAKVSLTVLINSVSKAEKLNESLTHPVQCYIELDTGANRTGLSLTNIGGIEKLINTIENTERLNFIGFYSHPGHSYGARSEEEILDVHRSVLKQIQTLQNNLTKPEDSLEVCIGDTPCCTVGNNFSGIDAVSPGNFVFYDLMQVQIGCCTEDNIAVAVECPIVDTYPVRNEIAIYGGAIHLSKESMETTDGGIHYGYAADKKESGWGIIDEHTYLRKISQEHGILQCSSPAFDRLVKQKTVTILPVHSCLTANLLKSYRLSNGQTIAQFQ